MRLVNRLSVFGYVEGTQGEAIRQRQRFDRLIERDLHFIEDANLLITLRFKQVNRTLIVVAGAALHRERLTGREFDFGTGEGARFGQLSQARADTLTPVVGVNDAIDPAAFDRRV